MPVMQPEHFHDYQNGRPGSGNQQNSEHDHLLGPFARSLDQVFATNIRTTKIPFLARVAIPSTAARLKETVCPRKTALLKLANRLHEFLLQLGLFHWSSRSSTGHPRNDFIVSVAEDRAVIGAWNRKKFDG